MPVKYFAPWRETFSVVIALGQGSVTNRCLSVQAKKFPWPWADRERIVIGPWADCERTVSRLWSDCERTVSGLWSDCERTVSGLWSDRERTVIGPIVEIGPQTPLTFRSDVIVWWIVTMYGWSLKSTTLTLALLSQNKPQLVYLKPVTNIYIYIYIATTNAKG